MVSEAAGETERAVDTPPEAPSSSEYVHALRARAGLSVAEVAARAGVSAVWLECFEAGLDEEGIDYGQLLTLVRATQPPRPDWWDDGHEHDLHLPSEAVVDRGGGEGYWGRIEQVRKANREARS